MAAVGSGFIEFGWDSVEGATRYEIQLSLVADSFDIVTAQIVSDGTKHRFEVSAETTGYARVRAEVAGRWGDYSDSVTGASLPPAPSGLRVTSTGAKFIEFAWDAVEGAASYDIQMALRAGNFRSAESATTPDTSHRFAISPDTTGYGRVRANFAAGSTDWSSDEVRGSSEPEPGACGDAARDLLLAIKSDLGLRGLENWSPSRPLSEWNFLTVDAADCVTHLDVRIRRDRGQGFGTLRGSIPPELGRLRHLRELYLGHDWEDLMESDGSYDCEKYGRWTCGQSFAAGIGHPGLSGRIPPELGRLSELRVLYIHGFRLGGGIPPELGQLTELRELGITASWWNSTTFDEDLRGGIPPELGQLSNLTHLFLFYDHEQRGKASDRLRGPIPEELGQLHNLRVLDLSGNGLSQRIPEEIGALGRLQILQLDRNDLSGPMPQELGDLSRLQVLDLYANELTGSIPGSFAGLSSLRRLDLRQNALTGCVPGSLSEINAISSSRQFIHPVNPQSTGDRLLRCSGN